MLVIFDSSDLRPAWKTQICKVSKFFPCEAVEPKYIGSEMPRKHTCSCAATGDQSKYSQTHTCACRRDVFKDSGIHILLRSCLLKPIRGLNGNSLMFLKDDTVCSLSLSKVTTQRHKLKPTEMTNSHPQKE